MSAERGSARWRHDMKNQLGIILGFSELLLDDMRENEARRADVHEIHVAAERAMELLSGVDESAKAESDE
jgi:signal transduction histidine kinase